MLGTSIGVRGLNPFGTGQCLTTNGNYLRLTKHNRLNPFGTGQCLTTNFNALTKKRNTSQSLWNRAVSYDGTTRMIAPMIGSQSLWNRAVSCENVFTKYPSQSLWNRAVSYDLMMNQLMFHELKSQSLWNRAVSYDST